MKFKFTIIMAAYNSSKWINEAIDSVINQTLDFKENIQLIIVDDGSTDNTKEIIKVYLEKYNNNIKYLYQENNGQASARNYGLKYAEGEFINFLDSDDKLESNACYEVLKFYDKYEDVDVVSIPLIFFGADAGEHILNYKFNETRLVDLLLEPSFIQLSASSSFIKKESIKNLKFNEKLITSEDALFINKILLEKCKLGVLNSTKYYYRRREDYTSTTDNFKKRKEYYNDQIKYYIKNIMEYSKEKLNYIPEFIQYLSMYTLQWIFEVPEVDNILSNKEIEELYNLLDTILQDINDNIILEQKNINENLKYHILLQKHHGFKRVIEEKQEKLKIQDKTYDTLGLKSFWIDIIEIRNNQLYIQGYLPSFFENNKTKIKAIRISNNETTEYIGKPIQYPKNNTFSLGKPVEEKLYTEIQIPIEKNTINTIYFKVRYDIEVDIPIQFTMNAKLSRTSHYTRTTYNKNQIKLNQYLAKNIDNAILIEPYTFKKYLKLEYATLKKIKRKKEHNYKEIILLRIITFILINTIYRNKKIWLFMDRQNTAKDNAEHLFKYSVKQKDKVKKYFIIDKTSPDYNKIKKYGKVVDFASFKHKLLFLLADKIISSHPGDDVVNPFWGEEIYQINGLLHLQYIFLQHGIINEDLSSWLKKCDMNLTIFVCSAQKEYDSIFQYPYNYPKEVVKILGLPRYDALNNNETKKQILIIPSWRHIFDNMTEDEFKQTSYFKSFNNLINDEELLNYCETKGYKLIFKPHPKTIKFIKLFNKDSRVTIDENFSMEYTNLFNQSKLLITDNSSVFYDFSYLKKPILYYHFKGDTPKFINKESEFDFENDGFGEVITNHNELIKTIKEYIKTDCKIKEKYLNRINKFYMYHDKNNCKRNYDAIMDLYKI